MKWGREGKEERWRRKGRGEEDGGRTREDKNRGWWDMPVSYNFSTWELEVGALGVEGQPQLHRADLGSHLQIKRNKTTIKEAVEQQQSRISWMFGEISLYTYLYESAHTYLNTYFIRASCKMSCLLWITAKPVKTEVTGEPTGSCRELQTSDTAVGERYENAQVLKESYP